MYHHFTNNFKNYFLKNKFLFSLKNYKQHKRYKKSKQTNRKSNESYLSESHSVQRDFLTVLQANCNVVLINCLY